MRKLKLFFACLLMAVLSIGQMWAADVTFTPGTETGATSVTKSGVTCTMTTMNNASYYQIYASQSGTFEVSSGNITKIEFTCTASGTSKYGPGNASANVGSYSYSGNKGTWTGEASTVTISSTAQIRMSTLTITVSTGSSEKTLSVDPTVIDFGTVEQGTTGLEETVEVTYANLTGSVTYSGLTSPFTASGTINASGDEITIAANTATIGEYSQTLTIQSTADSKSQEVTVKMNVVEPYDGLKLTFDVSSNPGEWPTTNSTTTTNYTYTLNAVDYTFALNNVKCNSGYLMLTAVAKLGLPAISGYKLVKVEATNSSGCSTSTQVSVSSSDATKTDVTGGAAQTWGTTSTKYTYNLSGTAENTMYYLWIANKNCQIVELVLYYEETEAAAVAQPSISGETPFLTSTTVTINKAEGTTVYYTTDGSNPKTSDTKQTYSAAFNLNANATVKAIATDGANWSEPVEKAFVKATVLSVALARAAIDAGGDLSNKYVAGIISQIDGYNSTYHSITYWISDDGTTTNQLQVYSGLAGVVKAAFASKDDLAVGDDVTVKGNLKKYNSTYEFDYNNTIEAYKPIARLAWSAESYDASLEGGNTFPTLTNTNGVTVTYSSSDPAKAEIADEKVYDITLNAVGSTTITASFEGNETYKSNSASYTLNIASSLVTLTYNVDGGEAIESVNVNALPNPLPTTTKAGKNFGGWFTDPEKEVAAVPGAAISENTTIYAKWLDPYTVAEAKTVIGDNTVGIANQYVAGIISQVDEYNSKYNSITYWISADGGTTGDQLQVYSGKIGNAATALEKENFTSVEDLKVGDIVVVTGTLKKYGEVYEFDKNNTIYSFTRPVAQTYSITYVENGANEDIDDDDAATNLPNPLPTVTKDEKIFGGWWTTSDFQVGTLAVAGAQLSDDVILYAKWEDLSVWATTYTSNVTIGTDVVKFSNDEQAPTYAAKKTGTGSAWGSTTVTVPVNTTKLHFHAVCYGADAQAVILNVKKGESVLGTFNINKDAGAKGNSPFILENTPYEQYYCVNLSEITEPTEITFEADDSAGKRFIIFGVNQEGGQVPELQSLVISGDLENKTYEAGASINPAGLTVMGTYTLGGTPQTPVDVTDQVEQWLYDALQVGDETVTISAKIGDVTSAGYEISGLTVNDPTPRFETNPSSYISFGSKVQGAEIAARDLEITLINVNTATVEISGTGAAAFSVDEDVLDGNATIHVSASSANVGTFAATLTISDDEGIADDKTINLSLTITAPEVPETAVSTTSEWVAATDADLVDGAEVLIVGVNSTTSKVYAAGEQGSNNRAAVEASVDGEGVLTPGANTMSFTLVAQEGSTFALRTSNGKYLYAASSSKNYLRSQAAVDDNAKWTLTTTSASAEASSNNHVMQFNGGSTLFSCYNTASQSAIAFYVPKPVTPPTPVYTEVRSGLEAGRHYTVCLENNVTAVKGATFWSLTYRNEGGTAAYLVEETAPFAAGKPYIFQATGDNDGKLEVVYGEESATDPVENGALRGTFSYMDAIALAAVEGTVYMLYNNALCPMGPNNHLDAHRAYVRYDLLTVPSTSNFAPGKRVKSMPMQGQTTTDIDALNASETPVKMIIDGQLFIIRGEKMYNVNGQLVK